MRRAWSLPPCTAGTASVQGPVASEQSLLLRQRCRMGLSVLRGRGWTGAPGAVVCAVWGGSSPGPCALQPHWAGPGVAGSAAVEATPLPPGPVLPPAPVSSSACQGQDSCSCRGASRTGLCLKSTAALSTLTKATCLLGANHSLKQGALWCVVLLFLPLPFLR